MQSRKLTIDDLPQFLDFLSEHKTLQRVEFDPFLLNPEKTYNQFWGTFIDDTLVMATRVVSFERIPAVCAGPIFLKRNFMKVFSWKEEMGSPAVNLRDALLPELAKEGRHTIYYTRSLNKWPERMRREGRDIFTAVGLKEQYKRYIEEIIPAGQRSKFELHDVLLLKREWPTDVMVVKMCKKNNFRQYDYELEEEDET